MDFLEFLLPLSSFFIVGFIVYWAWKAGYFKEQLQFAKSLPVGTSFKVFVILSLPIAKKYFKAYFSFIIGYIIRVAVYFAMFFVIYRTINDFELTVIMVIAIVLARVTMLFSAISRFGHPIILSPQEVARIKRGEASISDFKEDSIPNKKKLTKRNT